VSIELRTLLRGAGGLACAASTMVAVAAFAGAFSTYSPARATAASDSNNKGDVWVDTVGSNDGPEMDPHLPCADVAVWGMKLNDSSGPFAVQGWEPSGTGASDIDFSGTWTFDTSSDAMQQIAVIDVQTLINTAVANGDVAQPQQGFHFKLDLEDPRTGNSVGDDKYKVFWVNCTGTSSTPTPTATVSGSTPTPTPSESTPTPTPTETPSPTPTATVSGSTPTPTPAESTPTPSGSPTASGGVLGSSTTVSGGIGGIITPNTGSGTLPLGLSGGLMAFGLGMLAVARRLRPRRTAR